MKTKHVLLPLFLFTSLITAAFAVEELSSSTSYIISSSVMGATGGAITSSSYSAFGLFHGLTLGVSTSETYSARGGFIPASFPPLAVLAVSITPTSGYNTGTINITDINGAGFLSGLTVKLSRTGYVDITATNVTVESSSKITCTFDLTGKATGLWDLVVTNPGADQATLPSAFTVRTWATISSVVNSPNPFNPLTGPTTILYQLSSDTNTTVLIFSITHELLYRQDFAAGTNGGRAGDNSLTWNGYNNWGELAANGVYFCQVVNRTSGSLLAKGKIAISR